MNIYVAALASQIAYANVIADRLRSAGHSITSRWLDGLAEIDAGSQANAAEMDITDVERADVLVLLTLPKGTLYKGGGRNVEFGYALGRGKLCVIIGDYENIFCHLRRVRVVSTVEAALEVLREDSYVRS